MLSTSLSSVLFLASYAYASQKPLKIGGCLKRSSGPIVFNPTCDWHEEPGIELNKVLEIESSTFPLPAIEWPWSFAPYCVESGNVSDPICLYTSLTFARGRGISLITTPSEAKAIAQLEAFTNPSALADVNIERNPPYESRALPGRGIGLIANKTLYRGDHIFSHTPVLAVNDRLHQSTTPTDREFIQNGAVARLPEATRQKFLALHGHFGGDPISDIINTNSFDVEFSLAKQDHYIVLPETSVCCNRV